MTDERWQLHFHYILTRHEYTCILKREELIETLADFDDELAEDYLEGKEITIEKLNKVSCLS